VKLSDAIAHFFQAKQAERLSPNSIADYTITLKKFTSFMGERDIEAIQPGDIRDFFNSFERRLPGDRPQNGRVGAKTLLNYHICLSSLWTWATNEGVVPEHIIHKVRQPRPEKTEILPFTRGEVERMFAATGKAAPYTHWQNGKTIEAKTVTNVRDRAIFLVLVDTGLRASEICDAKIGDLQNGRIQVLGKGAKQRSVPISASTQRAIDVYLETRDNQGNREPLFESAIGTTMTRHALRLMSYRIARRAGVVKAHPHRFRHTFAVTFLRNGGNIYALQKILGHSTLTMVMRYLSIAQNDIDDEHKKASPVSNWGL